MQNILVQKYGGTSLGDVERIKKVASRVARAVQNGRRVVVAVSAMGHTTDRLIEQAKTLQNRPNRRELDVLLATGEQQSIALLSLALNALEIRVQSFTGQQAGFLTDDRHGNAQILEVSADNILHALDEDVDVAVVAGFQGYDRAGHITTLGRGGSDTTAVALAAALGVQTCEIYTDTEGIYTTDPHLVPQATKLETIDYSEMLELASLGAKVLDPRSVWYARRYGVQIHVRSSFSYNSGTVVIDMAGELKTDKAVTGVVLDLEHARINVVNIPDEVGVASRIFTALGEAGVAADMIIQGIPDNTNSNSQQLSFTIAQDVIDDALAAINPVLTEIGGHAEADANIAKLSIVGVAVGSTPNVAGTMFQALANIGANIAMVSSSEVRVSVIIHADKAQEALKAVHTAFGLDQTVLN